jgi:predicted nucleic acid-binding protein
MKAIADTGFLVAVRNRKDYHHKWALGIAERVTEPLLTCKAVLAETAFRLRSSALVLAMLQEGLVRPALVLCEHNPRLAELAALRRAQARIWRIFAWFV